MMTSVMGAMKMPGPTIWIRIRLRRQELVPRPHQGALEGNQTFHHAGWLGLGS